MSRLSICIPTYNFGSYIGATLESIVPQLVDGVEIVVLDGGSTDHTPEVVESFQRRTKALRYHRRDERGGIDRDLARTVELARGEYCWLFCADDLMAPDAIQRVLDHLRCGCDLYLCGLTLCTVDMQPVRPHRVARIENEEEFDLGRGGERRSYFARAQTTTAFFSFAGSLIFKRSRWEAAGPAEEFVGSLWAHVARILSMIPQGLRLHYLPDSYLYKRTDNDSFTDSGLVQRYAKAIDGYHRLASAYFPDDSPEARDMRRVVTNEFSPWTLRSVRKAHPEDAPTADRIAAKAYRDPSMRNIINRALYAHTPRLAFAAGQVVNQRVILRWRQIY